MTETAKLPPALTTETRFYQGQVVMVVCRGRLVAGTGDGFYDTIRALMPAQKRLLLHLAELQHRDSRGLGTLVRLFAAGKAAGKAAGCSVELMHLSRRIRHLPGLANLFDVFTLIGGNGVNLM